MRRLFLVAAIGGSVAVAAQAQEREGRVMIRNPEGRTFTYFLDGDNHRMTDARRGRIGITVGLAPNRGTDSIGARIDAVTDGGPAQRAGVRAGDVIVRWNDTRLAEGSGEADEFRSRPGQRLINLAQRLEPGDTVRLDVRRENRAQQFTVIADSADMDRIVERMRVPFMGGERMPLMERLPGEMMMTMMRGHGLGDLELVKVTPALAEGLGISVNDGLLVINIDSGSTLGLRAGDVITTIGGRRATTPEQAMRILSTYEANEAVQFDVMRQRRRQTVSGRVPEARPMRWRVSPGSWEMPLRHLEHDLEPLMDHLKGELPRLRHNLEGLRHSLPRLHQLETMM